MQDNHPKSPAGLTEPALSQAMSEHAFALWGVDDVAYIKQIPVDGAVAWAICAADGTSLGIVHQRDIAFAAAAQNDRVAVSVH